MLTIKGTNFGTIWLTSRQSKIGGVEVGKLEHGNDMVELITPPLKQGIHAVELFIENMGLAILRLIEYITYLYIQLFDNVLFVLFLAI